MDILRNAFKFTNEITKNSDGRDCGSNCAGEGHNCGNNCGQTCNSTRLGTFC